jgi:hypothetical protein
MRGRRPARRRCVRQSARKLHSALTCAVYDSSARISRG